MTDDVEKAILDHSLAHPCHGALRVADELDLAGIQVSSTVPAAYGDTACSAVTTGCCAWRSSGRYPHPVDGRDANTGTTIAFIVRGPAPTTRRLVQRLHNP